MMRQALSAALASLALLGCRDEAREIVVVDTRVGHAQQSEGLRARADQFEHAVAADAVQEPACAGLVIVEDRALRAGPVYQPMRQPHWVLAIGWVPGGQSQSWLLAHNETHQVRGYGEGTVPEIARALCSALGSQRAGSGLAGP